MRPTLSSNQARIAMDSSIWQSSSPRSITQSISLRARQKALPKAYFCLITHQVTWSILQMPSLRPRWSKVCVFFFFCYFDILISCKIPSTSEHTTWRGHTCTMASIPWQAPLNCFTFQMTTPPIQGGLKVWRTSFASTAFGLRGASLPTVLAPSILRDRPAAAAVTSFTHNPTSCHRSLCFRNSSSHVVICVITIPNTTISWISLSNTGEWQSFDFVLLAAQRHSRRWKELCWNVLMMFVLIKSKSEFSLSLIFLSWNMFAGLQTGLHISFLPTIKACPVPKQFGPTKSIMAITFYSPILSLHVGTLVSKQGVEAAFWLGMERKCDIPDSYSRPLAQVE